MIPPLFKHQEYTAEFLLNHPRTMIASDPGTGKTRSVLEAYVRYRRTGAMGRMLVFGPLSILQPAWGNDIDRWVPGVSYGLSTAGSDKKRRAAFDSGKDIVITNHDAVKWLAKNLDLLDGFEWMVVDESTAFKNGQSQRSKAMQRVANHFDRRIIMSGTMRPNSVLDMWHQALITDDGERLGKFFSKFRSQVAAPVQVAANVNAIRWDEKPGSSEIVADKLRDITVRFRMDDCLDMPENVVRTITVGMTPKHRAEYQQLEQQSLIEAQNGQLINAVHAGARFQKLLQLCSGAVYDENGRAHEFATDRYQLAIDLVAERDHSVVAFLWRHQRDALCNLADKAGISYGVIDGGTPHKERTAIVERFQAGELQAVFAHPQSAGHGLTLTRGCATIWASPTYNAEFYEQFNARIHRAGQTRRTETILIAAEGTCEERVYDRLQHKLDGMGDLLAVLSDETKREVA